MRNLTSLLLSCGIAFAMVSSLAAQTTDGSATVVRIKGSARYSQAGSWKTLKVGDVLKAGTLVQTGLDKGSYVDLVLSDNGSATPVPAAMITSAPGATAKRTGVRSYWPQAEQNVIRLTEDTALGIEKLTSMNTGADTVTETQLDLKKGRIVGNVKKLSPASKYEIKLPNGVAGIRGTLFDISADGIVRVSEGSVVIAYVGSNGDVITQTVRVNEQFDARTGRVTPLDSVLSRELTATGMELVFRGGTEPTTFTVDNTLYRVSPSANGD